MKNGTRGDASHSPALAEGPDETSGRLGAVIAATYTADPLEGSLRFWLRELGLPDRVEIAPYNQVFQQFLDPSSPFATGRAEVNLALLRFEDWARFRPGGWDDATIRGAVEELAGALGGFADRCDTPTILVAAPPSPKVAANPARMAVLEEMERVMREAASPLPSLHWIGAEDLDGPEADSSHDEVGDRVGHMPYTPLWNASLATTLARRIHRIKSSPYKVVALDCDHTLWKGVVGEDGPMGIGLGPGMKALQEFVVAQQEAGMVVCLVSKNAEADVLEALEKRPDFPLRRDHLVSWRVNWQAKSLNLIELSEELNLGLESFIFLDDNPVECAEVRAALPQVLTLQVPADEGMVEFLEHSWAFDRLKVTEEDRKRTEMYRQNADRTRLERQSGDIGSFLASLDLKVAIGPPSADQKPRVSQLTQRTNQFNFTTIRRSEAEVERAGREEMEVLRVEVSDRFGDYGLVGVMMFGTSGEALIVDTFLLSCRVLGRGVEHDMMAFLGREARARGLAFVEARLVPTAKNEPAANFLSAVASAHGSPLGEGGGTLYRIPTEVAETVSYRPGEDARGQLEYARAGGKAKAGNSSATAPARDKSAVYTRIATQWHRPEAVLRASEAALARKRDLDTPVVEPSTAIQRELADLWKHILLLDRVGVRDEFADLGGSSLQAAQLFVQIEARFGLRLPMSAILDAPTIESLAARVSAASRGESRPSLRLLRPGADGGPALVLVHDGDGETLLYLNLARRLPEDVAVYGLEPFGTDLCPMIPTRIPEMAADFVARIREARPSGPYLLGGLCAGGVIAFEMALQLREADQPVGFVALLDSAAPRAEVKPNLLAGRRLQRFVASLRGKDEGKRERPANPGIPASATRRPGGVSRIVRKAGVALAKVSNLVAYEAGRWNRERVASAKIRALREAGRGGRLPEGFVGPSVRAVYDHAETLYEPARPLDVPVLLFRAGGDGLDHPGDEPLIARLRDPLFDWAPRVVGGTSAIEVIDVAGGHGGMLQEPRVEAVAASLEAAIERAGAVEVCS